MPQNAPYAHLWHIWTYGSPTYMDQTIAIWVSKVLFLPVDYSYGDQKFFMGEFLKEKCIFLNFTFPYNIAYGMKFQMAGPVTVFTVKF